LPFIGLPGNPVSAFIGFWVFVRPALWKMSGLPDDRQRRVRVELVEPVKSDGRETYLRAFVVPGGDAGKAPFARLSSHQGSGNLRSLVMANALLMIPSGVKSVPAGEMVDAWLLGEID
jgi:molybdopterin molybdotransferase